MTWREKYRRDPDLAESIIETLKQDLEDAEKRIETLELGLRRIALCDWPGPLPLKLSRADWLQEIAKETLK
jgi:hypothetical protein